MAQKICPFCEKIFDQELVKDHIGLEHLGLQVEAESKTIKEEVKSFECEKCDNIFKEESDLKIHQNIAHPNFKFTCEICQKRFLTNHSFSLHMKILHA